MNRENVYFWKIQIPDFKILEIEKIYTIHNYVYRNIFTFQ